MNREFPDLGIIRPVRGKRDPLLAPDVLMIMIPGDIQYLAHRTGSRKIAFSDMALYGLYQNTDDPWPLTMAGPFIGAPHAVMGFEKLIALGAERFFMLGWCGSLQPGLSIGDMVVPTCGLSEEGTSKHYPIPESIASSDPHLSMMLEGELEKRRIPFTKGAVWTTDAIYRETPSKVVAYRSQGVVAVEMEVSALFTVARFRSVKMAALLVVSDELFDLKWRPGFRTSRLKTQSRAAADTLLELHCRLARKHRFNMDDCMQEET